MSFGAINTRYGTSFYRRIAVNSEPSLIFLPLEGSLYATKSS